MYLNKGLTVYKLKTVKTELFEIKWNHLTVCKKRAQACLKMLSTKSA